MQWVIIKHHKLHKQYCEKHDLESVSLVWFNARREKYKYWEISIKELIEEENNYAWQTKRWYKKKERNWLRSSLSANCAHYWLNYNKVYQYLRSRWLQFKDIITDKEILDKLS